MAANDFEQNEKLLRDPKTGRMMSKLASAASRAKFASESLTKDKEIVAQVLETSGESRLVQTYLLDFQKLVRDFDGPTINLRKIIPMIQEMVSFAKKDTNLSKTELAHVEKRATELIRYIQQRTSILSRTGSTLKRIAKDKFTSGLDTAQSNLSGSRSLIGKAAGSLIGVGRDAAKGRADAKKEFLETRADVFQNLLQSAGVAPAAKGRRNVPQKFQFDEDIAPDKPEKVSKSVGKKVGKKGTDSVASEGTLDAILTTDQAILAQLQTQTNLLRTNTEFAEQLKEEKDRSKDSAAAAAKGMKVGAKVEKVSAGDKKEGTSFLAKIAEFLGGLDIARAGLGIVGDAAKLLGPALGLMAKGAAVVGAAWVGWEVGSWISKMVGLGDSSDALAKLLDQKSQTIGSSLAAAGHAVVEEGKHVTGLGGGSEEDKAKADNLRIKAQEMSKGKVHGAAGDWSADEAKKFLDGLPKQMPVVPKVEKPVAKAVTQVPLTNFAPTTPAAGSSPVREPAGTNPPAQMHMSEAGLDALAKREGFVSEPKWDVNGWSIGFGDHAYHGMPLGSDRNSKPQIKISRDEAKQMLRERLAAKYEPIVRGQLTKPVTQNQFDSLVSVAYNSEAAGKRLAKRLNAGENLQARDFTASGTVGGKAYAPLQSRRQSEYAQFVSGGRAAQPVLTATAATNTGHGTIVAPTTVIAGGGNSGGGPQMPVVIPTPMTTDNPNSIVRALRDANSV